VKLYRAKQSLAIECRTIELERFGRFDNCTWNQTSLCSGSSFGCQHHILRVCCWVPAPAVEWSALHGALSSKPDGKCCRSMGQTDGQTSGRKNARAVHKACSAYAGSVYKMRGKSTVCYGTTRSLHKFHWYKRGLRHKIWLCACMTSKS